MMNTSLRYIIILPAIVVTGIGNLSANEWQTYSAQSLTTNAPQQAHHPGTAIKHSVSQSAPVIQQTVFTMEDSTPVDRKAPDVDEVVSEPQKPFIDLTDNTSSDDSFATNDAQITDNELFVRLGIWTVIVLCLCTLTVLALRHWQRSKGMLPVSKNNARVLESVALGPNRVVSLVELRGIQAVVGCDAGGIKTIVLAPPSFDDEVSTASEFLEKNGQE